MVKINFIKLPYCDFLPKEHKIKFNENIDRSTLKTKISGLCEITPSLIDVAKHEEKLFNFFKSNKIIAVFANKVVLWKDLAFLQTIILNIIILLSFGGNTDEDRLYNPILFLKYDTAEDV